MDNVRVYRLLVYEGPRVIVEDNLKRSNIQGAEGCVMGSLTIQSFILTPFPEVIKEGDEVIKEGDKEDDHGI